jgi:hypothetical protein
MDFHNTTLSDYEAQERWEHRQRLALDADSCWQDESFGEFWDAVEASNDLPISLDEGWALEIILDCWKQEGTVSSALKQIRDGYDPTPDTPYDFFH